MTRRRGILVEKLDYERLNEACVNAGIGSLSYHDNALLRRLDGGAAVVISSEGVSDSKIRMGVVYLDTQSFEWQHLPLDVVESCLTGETEDLADHIRTFGSRLDVNVLVWQEWAEKRTR